MAVSPSQQVATVMGKPVVFNQTAQGGGYVYDQGGFTIPPKTTDLFGTISSIVKSGLDVWKAVEETKLIGKQQPAQTERVMVIPSQSASQPYIVTVPQKEVTKQSPFSSIFENIPNVLKTIAQAPELVSKGEAISQTAERTGWIIFAGLIILGLIVLARSR